VTVYRDRSKSQQVIYFGIKKEREEAEKKVREEKEGGNEVLGRDVQKGGKGEQALKLEREVQEQRSGQRLKVQQKDGQLLKSLSSLRLSQSKYVEVSETYSGGCKSCEF
jgi:hypothetical protein